MQLGLQLLDLGLSCLQLGMQIRTVSHIKRHVESGQHGDPVTRAHFAAIANPRHGVIQTLHCSLQACFLAFGAGQQIALLHDLHFNLLHGLVSDSK